MAPGSGASRDRFTVLFVCTGNICRSPFAALVLRARLDAELGGAADRFVVGSAGIYALAGRSMDPAAARVLSAHGAVPGAFTARQLYAAHVAAADLVLTAAREHRAAVSRLQPRASRRTFTIREFGRIASAIPPSALASFPDPVRRAGELVREASDLRGLVRGRDPSDDDVPDPYGGPESVHRLVGRMIVDALAVPLDLILGRPSAGTHLRGG